MKEKDFISDFGRSVVALGGWWHKLPDPTRSQFRPCQKCGYRDTKGFSLKRPFDGVFVLQGQTVFCEMKVARPSIELADHQRKNLMRINRLKGYAVVIAYVDRGLAYMLHPEMIKGRVHKKHFPEIGTILVKKKGQWNIVGSLQRLGILGERDDSLTPAQRIQFRRRSRTRSQLRRTRRAA